MFQHIGNKYDVRSLFLCVNISLKEPAEGIFFLGLFHGRFRHIDTDGMTGGKTAS